MINVIEINDIDPRAGPKIYNPDAFESHYALWRALQTDSQAEADRYKASLDDLRAAREIRIIYK